MTRAGAALRKYVDVPVAFVIAVIILLGAQAVSTLIIHNQAIKAVQESRKGPACVLGQVPYQIEQLLGSLGIDSRARKYTPPIDDEARARLCQEFLRENTDLFHLDPSQPTVVPTGPPTSR